MLKRAIVLNSYYLQVFYLRFDFNLYILVRFNTNSNQL